MKYRPDLDFIEQVSFRDRKNIISGIFTAFCIDTNEVVTLEIKSVPEWEKLVVPEYYVQVGRKFKYMPNAKFASVRTSAGRKLWHDALVSGKHRQVTGQLKKPMFRPETKLGHKLNKYFSCGYCSLGIGVYIAHNENPDVIHYPPKSTNFFKSIYILDQFADNDPLIAIDENMYRYPASTLNDISKLKFKEIAKLIYPEAYYPVVEL